MDTTQDHDSCGECPLAEAGASRRDFLRDASRAALAALVAVGALPGAARALPLSFIEPARGGRTDTSERRYPIPAADGVAIDKENEVIVARAGAQLFAFALSCPHQNTALRWDAGAHRFQCPKHKSKYRPDGTFIEGRATRSMDRFAVRRDGQALVVDLDTLYREDTEAPQWAAAVVKL